MADFFVPGMRLYLDRMIDWQELLAGRVDVTISSILEAGKLSSTHDKLIIPFQKTANSLPLLCGMGSPDIM